MAIRWVWQVWSDYRGHVSWWDTEQEAKEAKAEEERRTPGVRCYILWPVDSGETTQDADQITKGDSAEPEREAREGSRKGL